MTMKKIKPFLRFSLLILLLELLAILLLATREAWVKTVYPLVNVSFVLIAVWFLGCLCLLIKKGNLSNVLSKLLTVCTCIAGSVLILFTSFCLLAAGHDYTGSFSASTTLFEGKNVMIIMPHQDDEINVAGGLIEQYTGGGSNVSVVFTTNGDCYATQEIRAAEAVEVLTTLGVDKEKIYYLGFGNTWAPQTVDGTEIAHIYSSPDPDLVWTSTYGATRTYPTQSIGCPLDLTYTRSNYLHALQMMIEEIMPDTLFVVDYDSHIDHRATDLLFEEALCRILTRYPEYHPTVYKGFSYGTAWVAVDDYFGSDNLLSTKKPDSETWAASAFGYAWEDRVRFPMSSTNLNWVFSNNSIYKSMNQYESQDAWWQAERVLNGDKVFWERRTDSLLYDAEIFIGDQKTELLNDFKLKDFQSIAGDPGVNSGVAVLQGAHVSVQFHDTVAVNTIYLYDNADPNENILAGHITFSDGSRIDFGNLNADGSATELTFPEKQIDRMEIAVTQQSGKNSGLSEIEAFYDSSVSAAPDDFCLMAVDSQDNFVYDYMLHGSDTVTMRICRFPDGIALGEADVTLDFTSSGKGSTYHWENDLLTVRCAKGHECIISISDGSASTTFSVWHPSAAAYSYLQALRVCEQIALNIDMLSEIVVDFLDYFIDAHFS